MKAKSSKQILDWFRALAKVYRQCELASMAGVNQPTVHRILKNEVGISIENYQKVEALWLQFDEILRSIKPQETKKGE